MVVTRRSEATVAQPVSEIVAIARAANRRIEHLALDVIGLPRGFQAFGEAASALAGTPECEQEQENGDHDRAVAQGRPHPWGGGNPVNARERHGDAPRRRVSRLGYERQDGGSGLG